ncbi:glycosyltransferase [Bacillus thuringiensis]|uniref:glycosyltransferase n=1 Tax=Bacillus thuringiensis TaxID=1428 RepID=UPI0021D67B58|nr:glycosyltransferase [Bacillus thuringiensis]MCU7667915.1 glycosyltransferase [Bacillus thuringiensis]
MSTISLCMIVKDEEKRLPNCLESVKDLVDEIIIVDTGSTDKTEDIAKDFGAQIYHFEWIHDFAAARNFSLEKATKDWILWLDADESIEKININELKEKLETTSHLGFEVEIHNILVENQAPLIHKSIRLFKNELNINFMNKVHEQPSIHNNNIPYYEVGLLPITVNHIGYREDVVIDKDNKDRNFKILKEELKHNPNNRFLHFNMANEYLRNEDYHNALYHYKIATNNKKDNEMLSHSLLKMVLALYELKRFDEMFELLNEGQKRFPDYTDIYYIQADILEKFGRDEEAKYLYELCLKQGNPKKNYITRQGVGDILPQKKLVDLYLKGGFYKKAATSLLQLISFNKYDLKVITSLMKLYKINFSEFDMEMVIKELYPGDDEQDMRIKLELSYSLRLGNLFAKTYPKIKGFLSEELMTHFDVFYHLSNQEFDIAKELLIKEEPQEELYLIQYYLFTRDASISDYANDDIKKLIRFLDMGKRKDAFHMSKKTYILFMDEAIRIKNEEFITKGLELSTIFNSVVKGELGNLFYSHLKYELAADYYAKYLIENENDFMVTLTVAEIYLALGLELDALKFAHKAMKLNEEHFRSIEIILEVYMSLNETEQAKSLAKEMAKYFPYDHYLKQF